MKKLINVTAYDIRLGIKKNCHKCPIARAIKRTLKAKEAEVSYATLVADHRMLFCETDDAFKIATFISNFDNSKPVKPFSFYVY